MDRSDSLNTESLDGQGLIVEDRRYEVFMVLGVTFSLILVAGLMWFAFADNLFGPGTDLAPTSPSIFSPSQSSMLPASVTQTGSSGLDLNFGSMSTDQKRNYIDAEDPNANVGSWPNTAGAIARPAEAQDSATILAQQAGVGVRGAEPVPFDFGNMTGEPWNPPAARGAVTLNSLSTQAGSVLHADGVINYQLSLSIDNATDGPISIIVRAANAEFPASQCFSAAPVYDGVYPYNACTVQIPDTQGSLPLATVFADGTGNTFFMPTESSLVYTFHPKTSGTYLFDFSATTSPGLAGAQGTARSVMATAQLFRGATAIGTAQLKTDLPDD